MDSLFPPFTAPLYFLHTGAGTMDYIKASERGASEQTSASLTHKPQDDKCGRLFAWRSLIINPAVWSGLWQERLAETKVLKTKSDYKMQHAKLLASISTCCIVIGQIYYFLCSQNIPRLFWSSPNMVYLDVIGLELSLDPTDVMDLCGSSQFGMEVLLQYCSLWERLSAIYLKVEEEIDNQSLIISSLLPFLVYFLFFPPFLWTLKASWEMLTVHQATSWMKRSITLLSVFVCVYVKIKSQHEE